MQEIDLVKFKRQLSILPTILGGLSWGGEIVPAMVKFAKNLYFACVTFYLFELALFITYGVIACSSTKTISKTKMRPKLSFVLVCSETNLWRTNQ